MTQLSFSEKLPILAVEQDCILSKQGDTTAVFELQLPEIFSLSQSEWENFHQGWVKALRTLPVGCIIHKQDWFTRQHYTPDFLQERSFLSHASERFFDQRPFLEHRCYLMLTLRPPGWKPALSASSNLFRLRLLPPSSLSPLALLDAAGRFQKILEDTQMVKLRRLNASEILSSQQKAGLIERYCCLLSNEVPLLRDLSFHKGLKVGSLETALFSLCCPGDLPALCGPRINYDRYSTDQTKFSIGFASPLGQLLDCDHIYNQFIFLEDPKKTIEQMERRRLRLQSLSTYSRDNALTLQAVNDFLNEAIGQQRMPVKAHFNILAWTPFPEKMRDLNSLVSAAISRMDAVPRQEKEGAAQIHWAAIPGNAASFPMNDTFDTFGEQACCWLNLESQGLSSPSPFGLRLGERLGGQPLHVDLSDEPMAKGLITNRNKFILGPSGSGKSFFTCHMVRSYFEKGTHIVLVDVGHSYQGLCQLLHGIYFTFSEKAPIRFNPFFLGDESFPDTEKKESIKTLLLALWKKDQESFSRSEYVALSNALQQFYEKPVGFRCFDRFYEFLQEDFRKKLLEEKVSPRDFDLPNLLYVLRPFYRGGEYDFLLNATENLDLLQKPFIVFELDNIKDHPILLPVVTLIIMEVFISKMRKLKGIRKMILIEEAWKAIAREGMAEYIKYLFKTVRKFFGEAVVVTQEVEDILSSPVVKQAILNNSDCKILLDQSKYQNKFEQIQQLLGLTEKEKTMVLSLNKSNDPRHHYKEVFISLGGTHSRVYRTEVSPEEYLTYTTEEVEKMRVQQATLEHQGDLLHALRELAESRRQAARPVSDHA